MTAIAEKREAQRRSGDKPKSRRADRKRELARHAISTLGQLGYARTTLRDIAEQSNVSLGSLHYYFEDKVELITYCVRMYKDEFIADLDGAIDGGGAAEDILARFIDGLTRAIRDNAPTHTLWYDISAQAMFDRNFVGVVREIEGSLVATVARTLDRIGLSGVDARLVYMECDGAFRHHLQRHVFGDTDALAQFGDVMRALFARWGATR